MTAFEHSIQLRLLARRQGLLGGGAGHAAGGELAELEAALSRLASGSFGACERCGSALGTQRLLAEPMARRCHACQEAPRE